MARFRCRTRQDVSVDEFTVYVCRERIFPIALLPLSRSLCCRDRSSASPRSICCDPTSRRSRTNNSRRRPWKTTGSKSSRRIRRCRSRWESSDSRNSIYGCAAEIKTDFAFNESCSAASLMRICYKNFQFFFYHSVSTIRSANLSRCDNQFVGMNRYAATRERTRHALRLFHNFTILKNKFKSNWNRKRILRKLRNIIFLSMSRRFGASATFFFLTEEFSLFFW